MLSLIRLRVTSLLFIWIGRSIRDVMPSSSQVIMWFLFYCWDALQTDWLIIPRHVVYLLTYLPSGTGTALEMMHMATAVSSKWFKHNLLVTCVRKAIYISLVTADHVHQLLTCARPFSRMKIKEWEKCKGKKKKRLVPLVKCFFAHQDDDEEGLFVYLAEKVGWGGLTWWGNRFETTTLKH